MAEQRVERDVVVSADERTVVMNAAQAELLNELTERLMREGDLRAMRLGSLVIAYKFAAQVTPPPPDNVVRFPGYSVRV